jgi:hypothetical protein
LHELSPLGTYMRGTHIWRNLWHHQGGSRLEALDPESACDGRLLAYNCSPVSPYLLPPLAGVAELTLRTAPWIFHPLTRLLTLGINVFWQLHASISSSSSSTLCFYASSPVILAMTSSRADTSTHAVAVWVTLTYSYRPVNQFFFNLERDRCTHHGHRIFRRETCHAHLIHSLYIHYAW